ncbi:MAG TPA: glycosyltransferase [Polyangiaceae bacterium]|jgi:rhamnosyltransferase|nr:glycosyltransferase [Polyangiaceae bacterium]
MHASAQHIDVVVRCKNEMPHLVRTLSALAAMDVRVSFVDSGSVDGSLEAAQHAGVEISRIAPEDYVPGRVINAAMARTTGDVVAFVNADAVPLSADAVDLLVAACRRGAAAAYGRQVARAGARRLTAADYDRAFPTSAPNVALPWFFSMAASAIRRDAWLTLPFDEQMRFSEDLDWTVRARALGLAIEYVPAARFEHSHDYDLAAMRRRMRGEGEAESRIFRRAPSGVARDLIVPFLRNLSRDVRARTLSAETARLRWQSAMGRFEGLRVGVSSRVSKDETPKGETRAARADHPLVARAIGCAQRRITAEFGAHVLATVLVGSFACGEGVVHASASGDHIYGDIDLVAVMPTRAEARGARERCLHISERASAESGVVVDVWPSARGELEDPRGRLMWVDAAVRGTRLIAGSPEVLVPLAKLDARAAASDEVGRLLANRATGFALSRLSAEAGAHDGATAARHAAKAWLAAGDAMLLLVDRYRSTLAARLSELQQLARVGSAVVPSVARGYGWALECRGSSQDVVLSVPDLVEHAGALWEIHAHLESHRLRRPAVGSPEQYAHLRSRLYAALPDVPPAGRVLAGVRAAAAGKLALRCSWRHPRETLARASVFLAFGEDRPRARAWAAKALRARTADPADVSEALVALREVGA